MARSKANTPTPTKRSSTARPGAPPKPSAAELTPRPVAAAQFETALERLGIEPPFALAVSGGADSMALMLLAAAWCKKKRLAPPHAFTVDHGLREDAAKEAARVAAWAKAQGVPHETLTWQGRKPARNIQADARQARYRLLAERMRAKGLTVLLTGHTLDDQAETFMLRLARGSGLDGLGAMSPLARFPLSEFEDLKLARPLLEFSHEALKATLDRLGQAWLEDPSNGNDRFARVKIRRALASMSDAGLTAPRISAAAAHLRRAREAIDTGVAALIAGTVELSPWGYALLATERFAAAPREVALRALSRLLEAVGGGDFPPRFEQVEATLDWLGPSGGKLKGRTLAGCRLARRTAKTVLVAREENALARHDPVLRLDRGGAGLWDGRFKVSLSRAAGQGAYEVRRLGPLGLKLLGKGAVLPSVEPHRIAACVPALWRGERLIAAPLAGFKSPDASISAQFSGLAQLTER